MYISKCQIIFEHIISLFFSFSSSKLKSDISWLLRNHKPCFVESVASKNELAPNHVFQSCMFTVKKFVNCFELISICFKEFDNPMNSSNYNMSLIVREFNDGYSLGCKYPLRFGVFVLRMQHNNGTDSKQITVLDRRNA